MHFKKVLDSSERWVDQGSEFYNNAFKHFLKNNGIIMYPTHNERKFVVAERFIRTLKDRIYKHMTAMNTIIHTTEALK